MAQDWFAQNSPPVQSQNDWFADNTPTPTYPAGTAPVQNSQGQWGSHSADDIMREQHPYLMAASDFGRGVVKGAMNTAGNLISAASKIYNPDPQSVQDVTSGIQDKSKTRNTVQAIGKGVEQAGEFLLPGGAEDAAAALFGGKVAPLVKIGAQALSGGAVNAAQGGSFRTGAAAGALGGGIAQGVKAVAPVIAESALGVRNVDRAFGRTPGAAILEDTKGITPGTIADAAKKKAGELTNELENKAADSSIPTSTRPAIDVIDSSISKYRARNSPIADDLQDLKAQLTVNRTTGTKLSPTQTATGVLNLKRGVGDTIGKWTPEQKKGVEGVAQQVYGALDAQLDRAVPEAQGLNQRISSLIAAGNVAGKTANKPGLAQRLVNHGIFGAGGAGTGAAIGAISGGRRGAEAGALTGAAFASPVVRMAIARALYGPAFQASLPVALQAGRRTLFGQ